MLGTINCRNANDPTYWSVYWDPWSWPHPHRPQPFLQQLTVTAKMITSSKPTSATVCCWRRYINKEDKQRRRRWRTPRLLHLWVLQHQVLTMSDFPFVVTRRTTRRRRKSKKSIESSTPTNTLVDGINPQSKILPKTNGRAFNSSPKNADPSKDTWADREDTSHARFVRDVLRD